MSLEHLRAILWLRWRLGLRQWKRGSAVGGILAAVVAAIAVLSAVGGFGLALGLGIFFLPAARPEVLLLVWDAILVAFLLFWVIGVLTDLQRSELLSMAKLLHFPMSLRGVFVLNYCGSLLSLSLIVFVPTLLGLGLASVFAYGMTSLVVLPLIFGTMFMVTAVTHQFRGWLGALMVNKRRRGTIIAFVTILFVLVANIPTFFNLYNERREEQREENQEHSQAAASDEGERKEWIDPSQVELALSVNRILPPVWLAYGAWGASQGRPWPAVLATLGTLVIGALSLGRSYRTTLRVYRAHEPRRRRRKVADRRQKVASDGAAGARFLEWTIPYCPEQAAAIAVAGLRTLIRAPQAKMMLLTPVILIVVFGGLLFGGRGMAIPPAVVPLMPLAAIGIVMLTLSQLLQNLFGFDGDGFRVFVLSGAPRSEILLGKNLSIVPFAALLGGISLVGLQFVLPLRSTHLAASFLQLISVCLLCCMVGNLTSTLVPMAMSSGTMKPVNPGALTLLKQFAFTLLIPLTILPAMIPLGMEMLGELLGWKTRIPIYLVLSALEVPVVVWIYRRVLVPQGRLLARREQRILEVVGAPPD